MFIRIKIALLIIFYLNYLTLSQQNDNIEDKFKIFSLKTDKVYLHNEKINIGMSVLYKDSFFQSVTNSTLLNQNNNTDINAIIFSLYDTSNNALLRNETLHIITNNQTLLDKNKSKYEINDQQLKFGQDEILKAYLVKNITTDNLSGVNKKLKLVLKHKDQQVIEYIQFTRMAGIFTLFPVFFLLVFAIVSSQALIALFFGLWISSSFVNGFNPLYGFLRLLDQYTVDALSKKDNVKVVLFTFYLSGLVGIIQKSGGAKGLAQVVTKFAKTRFSVQWATYILSMVIFFDDFASCLIVGSNMQPITDLMKLSREKLAYITHSTSSPPASISPISSWIGFELSLISEQMDKLGLTNKEPFVIFMKTIPYRFFPILTLVFVAVLIFLKRDFGPMLKAERRAYKDFKLTKQSGTVPINDISEDISEKDHKETPTNPMLPTKQTPARSINAIVPIFLIITVTVLALFLTGYYKLINSEDKNVILDASHIAGAGDPYTSLIYSSFFACFISWIMYRIQRIMSFKIGIDVFIEGIKDVVDPVLILILAWSIGMVFDDLKSASYIVSIASSNLSKEMLPTLIFILSCVISFATGTSWGTMTVMFPLVIPLAYSISEEEDYLVKAVASILTGAIFGDQCSPISGTSILTALSCKVPIKDHIVTQLPYAILAAVVSVLAGYIPVGFGLYPHYVGLIVGSVLLIVFVLVLGTKTESNETDRFSVIVDRIYTNLKKVCNMLKKIFHKN